MENIEKEQKNGEKFGINFSFFILLYVIFSALFGVVFTLTNADNFIKAVFSPLAYVFSIIIVILINNHLFGGGFKVFSKPKIEIKYLLYAVVISLVMFFLLGELNQLFSELLLKLNVKPNAVELQIVSPVQYVVALISLAIVPAVFEELFFRKFLLFNLRGNTIILSLISALVFSLYHVNLYQFIYQFIYGFVLTYLAIKSKSVLPCILSHFINNFLVITFLYFNIATTFYSIWHLISGIIILSCILFRLSFGEEKPEKVGYGKMMLYSLFGIVICLIFIILGAI